MKHKPDKTIRVWEVNYKTTHTKKYENRKPWQKPNEKEIISFIPGTIKQIFLETGQKVKAGDDLMTYEAMKMNNIIKCPYDGVIKSIPVETGQKVPKGTLLMEYSEIVE